MHRTSTSDRRSAIERHSMGGGDQSLIATANLNSLSFSRCETTGQVADFAMRLEVYKEVVKQKPATDLCSERSSSRSKPFCHKSLDRSTGAGGPWQAKPGNLPNGVFLCKVRVNRGGEINPTRADLPDRQIRRSRCRPRRRLKSRRPFGQVRNRPRRQNRRSRGWGERWDCPGRPRRR